MELAKVIIPRLDWQPAVAAGNIRDIMTATFDPGGSMNFTTKVKKSAIVRTLKDNKVTHKKTLKKATKAWREKVLAASDRMDEVTSGAGYAEKDICEAIDALSTLRHQVPTDMSKTYDDAIAMVESHSGQHIELEESDFRQLMQDQWSWKRSWNDTVSNYMALS